MSQRSHLSHSRLTRASWGALIALTTLTLALTGCAAPSSDSLAEGARDDVAPAAEAASWPRTIDIPAGRSSEATTLTIPALPERIAALDYESAEVLAELGLSARVVLVPEAVLNPVLGGYVDELSAVEATFPVAGEIDAESVIALTPDLVVMSPRHGNEAPIAAVLERAGVAALQLPQPWVGPDTLFTNVELIGEATGAESQAEALVDEIEQGLAAAAAGSASEAENSAAQPRVLVLTNQAGQPFVTAGNAYPLVLLALAGGQNVATELGIECTGPITAEQLVEASPDGIVLIDMNGTGDRMFAPLFDNAAVAALPAVAEGRVLRVEGRQVQALGLASTVDGLGVLTD